jgi:hypothetical protein
MKNKYVHQWWWSEDHLGNKVQNFYYGPKLDWTYPNKKKIKKGVSNEYRKNKKRN